jgi:site-specific DNA-methyltransferase (adenine-specific)
MVEKIGEFDLNKVYCMDCFEMLSKIPNNSVDLVLIDPPYFQVMVTDWKGGKHDWDSQWKDIKEYQEWIQKLGNEIKRVLKDNGSFYIFADDKICAYVQVILDRLFQLVNSITWVKPNNLTIKGWTQYRSYAPITEKILFYSNEWDINSGKMIYDKILDEHLKPNNKFSQYLQEEFNRAKVTRKELSKLFPSKTGGMTGCVSNWLNGDNIITKEQYEKIRGYLNRNKDDEYLKKDYEYLKKDYEDLKKDYEDLKKDYEDLRRPFNPDSNFTDVWTFNIMGGKESLGKHPTQKPIKIIKRIIKTSSKEGDVILDCFMGSGTTAKASKELKRNFIGCDNKQEYVDLTNKRLQQEVLL